MCLQKKKIIASFILFTLISLSPAEAVLGYLTRGLKHCTGVCDQENICSLDQDETFRWCVKKCSHKIKVKEMCEASLPLKIRPILPYEDFSGTYNTNQVSPLALSGLDINFIKQTTDRKRVIGTAKRLLLVAEQYLNGKNVQKMSDNARAALAEKLLRSFYKNDPKIIKPYEDSGTLPDGVLAVLFDNLKGKIMAKYEKENG